MGVTPKLGIKLMADSDVFAGTTINNIVTDVDDKVLGISHAASKAHFEMWGPGKPFATDAIVKASDTPSWGVWQCTTGGTSGTVEISGTTSGMVVTDGTCEWKLISFSTPIHNTLAGRTASGAHPILAITGLQDILDALITTVDAKAYTDTKIADLINGAPSTLDTLKEISDALAADDNLLNAMATAIDTKVDKVAGKGLSTNDYSNIDKAKVDNISITQSVDLDDIESKAHTHLNYAQLVNIGQDSGGNLTYGGNKVYNDVRTAVFQGGSSELLYPWNGTVQKITVICSEPQTADLSFNVEIQTKADYTAKANNWNLVGGSALTLTANTALQEYTSLSNTNLIISAGDVIRASTAGDDTGLAFHITILNN